MSIIRKRETTRIVSYLSLFGYECLAFCELNLLKHARCVPGKRRTKSSAVSTSSHASCKGVRLRYRKALISNLPRYKSQTIKIKSSVADLLSFLTKYPIDIPFLLLPLQPSILPFINMANPPHGGELKFVSQIFAHTI